jgi:AcrR family transcriptional regulator
MVRSASLKPRKAPRQRRSAVTVEAILEAAARILETQGLEGYTTNAVAEKAGVSIGSLYQYFPGKDALTGALIRRETAQLVEEAMPVAGDDGKAAIDRWIMAAVAHQLRRPALARILDFEEGRHPEAHGVYTLRDRAVSLLKEVLALPDLPSQPDAEIAAGDILAMVRGMIDAAGERGETDRNGLERRVGRAVFGYLGAV